MCDVGCVYADLGPGVTFIPDGHWYENGGNTKVSRTPYDNATFVFTGTSIEVLGAQLTLNEGLDGWSAYILEDGSLSKNTEIPPTTPDSFITLFSTSLPAGDHTLTVHNGGVALTLHNFNVGVNSQGGLAPGIPTASASSLTSTSTLVHPTTTIISSSRGHSSTLTTFVPSSPSGISSLSSTKATTSSTSRASSNTTSSTSHQTPTPLSSSSASSAASTSLSSSSTSPTTTPPVPPASVPPPSSTVKVAISVAVLAIVLVVLIIIFIAIWLRRRRGGRLIVVSPGLPRSQTLFSETETVIERADADGVLLIGKYVPSSNFGSGALLALRHGSTRSDAALSRTQLHSTVGETVPLPSVNLWFVDLARLYTFTISGGAPVLVGAGVLQQLHDALRKSGLPKPYPALTIADLDPAPDGHTSEGFLPPLTQSAWTPRVVRPTIPTLTQEQHQSSRIPRPATPNCPSQGSRRRPPPRYPRTASTTARGSLAGSAQTPPVLPSPQTFWRAYMAGEPWINRTFRSGEVPSQSYFPSATSKLRSHTQSPCTQTPPTQITVRTCIATFWNLDESPFQFDMRVGVIGLLLGIDAHSNAFLRDTVERVGGGREARPEAAERGAPGAPPEVLMGEAAKELVEFALHHDGSFFGIERSGPAEAVKFRFKMRARAASSCIAEDSSSSTCHKRES
ncbi:uncharacterized protein BXZ73DRAFT_76990 [Epithele typhae]|uniref:uncharacterized protein n=1 Tax=Epithele typhae TaxID=378194 RepID=UPI00200886A8|nr:uncharacterized protein BXZ73DRAFT_76990 [Epithele typhae]KAH9934505.1 hypothetical protein BXZ73DRAFT_76990 [Epithele typhae]